MKLLIDEGRFSDYTQIHKREIGEDIIACLSGVITGTSIVVPACLDQLRSTMLVAGDIILLIVGGIAFIYGFCGLIKFFREHYSANVLLEDVRNMNETQHRFSLVAVKDTFAPYANRFLLHYDPDWKCNLFFSFHTADKEEDNLRNIRERLSNSLKISEDLIDVNYIDEIIQTKFSERDKVKKVYDHRLYSADIKEFPSFEKEDSFVCDNVSYKWMTIARMREDPEIQKKNLDVVDFVDANIS